jgi:hypothetical protein
MKRAGFGSVRQRYRSADSDLYQNVTDPEKLLDITHNMNTELYPGG